MSVTTFQEANACTVKARNLAAKDKSGTSDPVSTRTNMFQSTVSADDRSTSL